MSNSSPVDRFGVLYNVTQVLGADGKLDTQAYAAYSPVYISITFAMTLTLAFALSTAILVHTALFHGPTIWKAMKHTYSEDDDIHMKLMRSYPEVPDWWFLAIFVFSVVVGIIAIEVSSPFIPTNEEVWNTQISYF